MESAWEKVSQSKFGLGSYNDAKGETEGWIGKNSKALESKNLAILQSCNLAKHVYNIDEALRLAFYSNLYACY